MKINGIQKVATNVGGVLVKNSPIILTGISVAGLFATAVLAVRATPKALLILEKEEETELAINENSEFRGFTKSEIIKLTWKCYIPAAIMGAATMGCIIGANSINLRRNAALASVYSLSEAALKEYQAKVVETLGKDKAKEIKDSVIQDKIIKHPISEDEIIRTGMGDILCYDAFSGRKFRSDPEVITKALNRLSHKLMSEMFISLNQVYSELNMEENKLGDLVGWHIDQVGDNLISPEFSSVLDEYGRPCLVLDFEVEPKYADRDY